jgi:hypothetical protein
VAPKAPSKSVTGSNHLDLASHSIRSELAFALALDYAVYAAYNDPSWFSLLSIPDFSLPNPSGFSVIVDLFLSHFTFGIEAVIGFLYGLGMRPKESSSII